MSKEDSADKQDSAVQDPLLRLQEHFGYRFKDMDLLRTALTHRSYSHEMSRPNREVRHNERLEFLGDAVLGLVVAEWLMNAFEDVDEGDLSRARASLVSEGSLAEVARTLGLGDAMRIGRGEEQTGGRSKSSILSDALEATLAAVYLDGGMQSVVEVLHRVLKPSLDRLMAGGGPVDSKSRLQELVQGGMRILPQYRVVGSSGPAHDMEFEVEVAIAGHVVLTGRGRSKKQAEQDAAAKVLKLLDESPTSPSWLSGDEL